jgi:5'-nucleotidase
MAYDLSKLLVVGISSRALFDLEDEDRIFRDEGLQAFIDYQRKHEDIALAPGCVFPLIKGLLGLNAGPGGRKIEVVLLSRNHPDVSLRVFNSIDRHGLDISRAALTGGAALGPYLGPFHTGLFLSQSVEDVQSAANQGFAAGLIYSPPADLQTAPRQIRIAFDGDCVIFSDEAQRIFDENGLEAFYLYEQENAKKELPAGPFAKLLRTLSQIQGSNPDTSPVRIALFTDRNMPAHERVIRTLRAWNVRLDEAFFLGGVAKTEFIKAFGANIFFDDKEEYCKLAADQVPTGRVLSPIVETLGEQMEDVEVTVKLESVESSASEDQFLLICKRYLKRDFPSHETELNQWYLRETREWPEAERLNFLNEFTESVKETPRGSQRRAVANTDTPKEKLLTFLGNLAVKHRPH